MISCGCAPVLLEAFIITEGGFPQPKKSVFEELRLSGHFFVDGLVFGKDLSLMPAFHICVFGAKGLVDPDFQMGFKKSDLGGLSDQIGRGAVAVGIDGYAEIDMDQTIDLFEESA